MLPQCTSVMLPYIPPSCSCFRLKEPLGEDTRFFGDYFKDYNVGKLLLDLTLIRPVFTSSLLLIKKLVKSKKAAAIVIGVLAAAIFAGGIVLSQYPNEVQDAFNRLEGFYAALATPAIGFLGAGSAVIVRIKQYTAFTPQKTFGKSRKPTGNMGAGLEEEVGKMREVRMYVDFINKFLAETPICIDGKWYRVKLVISIDDLDRCKPDTIANVSCSFLVLSKWWVISQRLNVMHRDCVFYGDGVPNLIRRASPIFSLFIPITEMTYYSSHRF